jgi:hypothetical protein
MSDISSLQSQADKINRSLDRWNSVYVWGLLVALIAGAITLTAQRRAIVAGRKLFGINNELSQAKDAELEAEKSKRVELEKSLAPRAIALTKRPKDGTSNVDELKPFAGVNVILRALTDAEAIRAAQNLSDLLTEAGWHIVRTERSGELAEHFFDGVVIEPFNSGLKMLELDKALPPNSPPEEHMKLMHERSKYDVPGRATDALVTFLTSNNWVSRRQATGREVPENTLVINVGFKPAPYFPLKGDKEGVTIFGNSPGVTVEFEFGKSPSPSPKP